jgi:hypothetical protein
MLVIDAVHKQETLRGGQALFWPLSVDRIVLAIDIYILFIALYEVRNVCYDTKAGI